MNLKKLKENLYYVGTLNPNMRVFDIIMKTEYGTSYNAYLVKGEKTALIETCHHHFWELYKENIEQIMPLSEIDYMIFNHTEPDHSGVLDKLLAENPEIQVVGSTAALRNLTQIANRDFNKITAKDGDTLDLGGGMVLKFISAPNLHWPDTMFTYCESLKTVFTCDFLGAHYCEPAITDDLIPYPEAYRSAVRNYFDAIMGPFKKFVLAGLDKLEALHFDMICTSHGPVLKTGWKKNMELYREWASTGTIAGTVTVFYISAYGFTRMLAEAFAEGVKQGGAQVELYDIIQTCPSVLAEKIETSAGYAIGSPTINRDAVRPAWDVLSMIDPISNKGKPVFIFGSYGWSGEGCKNLTARAEGIGLKPFAEAKRVVFKPTDEDLNEILETGKNFAAALKK